MKIILKYSNYYLAFKRYESLMPRELSLIVENIPRYGVYLKVNNIIRLNLEFFNLIKEKIREKYKLPS